MRKRRSPGHILAVLIAALFSLCLLAGMVFILVSILLAPKLSDLDATPKGYRSSVLDDAGEVVLTLQGEASNRVYVKLEETTADLQHAFVAIEDERFYTHHGVDIRGIGRALVKGITSGHFSEGASTITQQLIKNNVLTGWTEEKTFVQKLERKIQEQYLAILLETKESKDWILENYLNTINLGGGNWGVETASKYYFGKDVSDLTLSESACLAAITKNPTAYNPLKNPEKNEERRRQVLDKMLEKNYIDQAAYDEAISDNVYQRIAEKNGSDSGEEVMSYFEDAMIYSLIDDLKSSQNCTEEEAWNLLYKGGLTIRSTVNSSLQAAVDAAQTDGSLAPEGGESSVVLIDNATGEVKAMSGGRGEKTASLIYNRATSAIRQPGSSIKIIGEYAAALNSGLITLGSVMDDAPYTYSDGTAISNSDASYRGMTTIRDAIIHSNNVLALKTFQKAGMDIVWDQLRSFGISTLTDADKVEALALGGTNGGVTNLEMTAAYGTIARGGTYTKPVYYTEVLSRDGSVLLSADTETKRAVSEDTSVLLTSAMRDVLTEGTGGNAYFSDLQLAGKSGTTTGIRDSWFIGYSPYLTCGVWGGYDDNRTQEDGSYVQKLWKEIMSSDASLSYEGDTSKETFDPFDTSSMTTAYICKKSGKLAVEGLCDSTLQGDESAKEIFVPGTEPILECDNHVAVTLCTESGKLATKYCPSTRTEVYLKSGTEGTDDEAYVLPEGLDVYTCPIHTSPWSGLFDNDNSDSGSSSSDDSNSSSDDHGNNDGEGDSPSGGISDWWNSIFGN